MAYVYAGYPLLLRVWARMRPKPLRIADCGLRNDRGLQDRSDPQSDPQSNPQSDPQSAIRNPHYALSIVIAARNEAARLPARLDNLLSLDYPADRRQIIVVSDGSTDDTLDVLARYQPARRRRRAAARRQGGRAERRRRAGDGRHRRLRRRAADVRARRPARAGRAVRRSRRSAPSPANCCSTPSRPAAAPAPIAAPSSGAPASAPTASDRRADDRRRTLRSTIADGVGLYWRYEKQLRRLESTVGSTLGATGAIYAIRRSLYRPLPADTILDDVLAPMRVVLAGYRVVFNERARAFDRAAADADAEARRKIRTLAGNYQILSLEPRLLLPWKNPVWLQYLSHKLGRLVVPYALLAIFFASIVLAAVAGPISFYGAVLTGQVMFYLLAGVGAVLELAPAAATIG